jgi:hypothetical protein
VAVDNELLYAYRERLKLELEKIGEEISMARYEAKRVEAETYVISRIAPDDLEVARKRKVFDVADLAGAQQTLARLIEEREALRRILLLTS